MLVQGVSGERGGMGYFGYSYYTENRNRLNAVQVRNPKTDQCVTPGVETVHNNSYKPLSRPLFIYAKGSSFKRHGGAGVPRLHLRQRGRDREARALRPAHEGPAEAGEDELRPRA